MQLQDVVLGQRERLPGLEDQLHHRGVAGDLLFIATLQALHGDAAEKRMHRAVGECHALDARGRCHGLDGRDSLQAG